MPVTPSFRLDSLKIASNNITSMVERAATAPVMKSEENILNSSKKKNKNEQKKHLEQTLAIYVYSHCNICNILIYFLKIHMKHLQRTLKHLKQLKHTLAT
jgi:hypothetical protein